MSILIADFDAAPEIRQMINERVIENGQNTIGVILMQWHEVRTIYPDQYVFLKILVSHTENNIQFVDEVALVRAIQDPDEATRELLKCKNNNIVYHTGQERIPIEIRTNPLYRSR
jgi:hypothetical protein